jgi:hypothetical protein
MLPPWNFQILAPLNNFLTMTTLPVQIHTASKFVETKLGIYLCLCMGIQRKVSKGEEDGCTLSNPRMGNP